MRVRGTWNTIRMEARLISGGNDVKRGRTYAHSPTVSFVHRRNRTFNVSR